jgi:hypothetical protein
VSLTSIDLEDRPGVSEDLVESLKWCLLAAQRGFDPSPIMEFYRQRLTKAEALEAQHRAHAYADEHWQTVALQTMRIPAQ